MHPELHSPDRRLALNALRQKLASEIEDCESKRDLASLAVRFQSVLAEIAEIDSEGQASAVDDLASKRKARRAAAKDL